MSTPARTTAATAVVRVFLAAMLLGTAIGDSRGFRSARGKR